MSLQNSNLIESKEFLNALFNTMPTAVFILDKQVRVQNINKAFTALFQKHEKDVFHQLCGNAMGCVFPIKEETDCGKTVNCQGCALRRSVLQIFKEKGGEYSSLIEREFLIEGVLKSKNFHVVTKYLPYQDAEYVLVIIQDVTDFETQRKHLQELYKTKEQLLQQIKRNNADLQEFAHKIAHDLKKPAFNIVLITDLLLRRSKEHFVPEVIKELDQIAHQAKFMNKLIEGVLEYSLLGYKDASKEDLSLEEEIKSIIKILNPPNNIKFEILGDFPTISMNRSHCIQLFSNLINNAIKFIDKPEGLITVQCQTLPSEWQLSVTDNGSGIERKNFQRIFDLFQTVKTSNNSQGTGVGLAVVKKIVELYGGKIWVDSTFGSGSSFFFTFPKPNLDGF